MAGYGILVVVLVGLESGLASAFRPVQAALLPWLARTPDELTSANSAASVLQAAAMVIVTGSTETAESADEVVSARLQAS